MARKELIERRLQPFGHQAAHRLPNRITRRDGELGDSCLFLGQRLREFGVASFGLRQLGSPLGLIPQVPLLEFQLRAALMRKGTLVLRKGQLRKQKRAEQPEDEGQRPPKASVGFRRIHLMNRRRAASLRAASVRKVW